MTLWSPVSIIMQSFVHNFKKNVYLFFFFFVKLSSDDKSPVFWHLKQFNTHKHITTEKIDQGRQTCIITLSTSFTLYVKLVMWLKHFPTLTKQTDFVLKNHFHENKWWVMGKSINQQQKSHKYGGGGNEYKRNQSQCKKFPLDLFHFSWKIDPYFRT